MKQETKESKVMKVFQGSGEKRIMEKKSQFPKFPASHTKNFDQFKKPVTKTVCHIAKVFNAIT